VIKIESLAILGWLSLSFVFGVVGCAGSVDAGGAGADDVSGFGCVGLGILGILNWAEVI